jgi:hypothetical protein
MSAALDAKQYAKMAKSQANVHLPQITAGRAISPHRAAPAASTAKPLWAILLSMPCTRCTASTVTRPSLVAPVKATLADATAASLLPSATPEPTRRFRECSLAQAVDNREGPRPSQEIAY